MIQEVCFQIDGDPVPKERPRRGEAGVYYTPFRTREWETLCREQIVVQIHNNILAGLVPDGWEFPISFDVDVEMIFFRYGRRRADLTNLAKAIEDALNGIVWKDDSQIVRCDLRIVYGVRDPGVSLLIRKVE